MVKVKLDLRQSQKFELEKNDNKHFRHWIALNPMLTKVQKDIILLM
jgi:hypothetical protein